MADCILMETPLTTAYIYAIGSARLWELCCRSVRFTQRRCQAPAVASKPPRLVTG